VAVKMQLREELRFTAILVVSFAAIVVVYGDDVAARTLGSLTRPTAALTHSTVQALGLEADRIGNVLSHPGGFAYEVSYRCVGFLPIACLAAVVLASRGRFTDKLAGILVGVLVLSGFNQARLVHLYYVGVNRRDIFDAAHIFLWGTLTASWLCWLKWSRRRTRPMTTGRQYDGAQFSRSEALPDH
jgi:exosortase/archaeosortase family protein